TAEWLDLVIDAPGRPQRTVRCQVFDTLGPAARAASESLERPKWDDNQRLQRAAGLSGLCDNLITSSRFSRDFFRHRVDSKVLDSRDTLLKAWANPDAPENRRVVLKAILPHPLELFTYVRSDAAG